MNRREAGFSFIEILVVMGIITLLVGMVAVIVPRVQESGRQTKSTANVRSMVTLMANRSTAKGWPGYSGKNFNLSLVATGDVDIRNKDNLEIFFSPGDRLFTLDKADFARYKEISPKNLKAGADFHELTSYAGRRNADRDFLITPDQESMGAPIICDDDVGNLHHPKGLVIGYTNTQVRFVEWNDLGMTPPEDADNPDPFLGDRAEVDLLRPLSSD
jgi:type II secretory pathway pseudopilin PulG